MKKSQNNDNQKSLKVGIFVGMLVTFLVLVGSYVVYKSIKDSRSDVTTKSMHSKISSLQKHFFITFESRVDINLFENNDGAVSKQSLEFATNGQKSLLVEFPKGRSFPGLQLEVFGRDVFNWKLGKFFLLDVYNPNKGKLKLNVKIKSGKNYPKKSFEKVFTLDESEGRTIRIKIKEIAKEIDINKISYINFFVSSPNKKQTLFLDNIRISQSEIIYNEEAKLIKEEKEDSVNLDNRLELRVYPQKKVHPISPLIYGSNLTAKTEFEMDVAKLGKSLGVSVMRFPGSSSEGYHWKEGVFDFNERFDAAPLSKMENVIKFAKIMGSSLVLQVNIESGTPQEAADWVKFMNETENFPVTYWEMGNEVYGDWERNYMSGSEYAAIIKQYAQAMKAVDPSIKIGANLGGPGYQDFDEAVIREAADHIDFVSYHWYPNHINASHKYKGRDHPLAEEIMGNYLAVESMKERVENLIEKYAPHRKDKIETTFLEWDGSWDGAPSDLDYEYQGMMWSLANAIFYADTLGQFALHQIPLAINYSLQEVMFGFVRGWDRDAGWGGNRWDGDTIRPKAFALKLFSEYFGDSLIEQEMQDVPTFYKEQDWRSDSYSGYVPYVSAYSSTFEGQSKIAIALINKHATQDYTVKILVDGVTPKEVGKVWILNGPALEAQNDGQPHTVKIDAFHVEDVGPSFLYNLPAHSVNMLQILYEDQ